MKREERAGDGDAVMSDETPRADRRAAVARARAETEDKRRTNEVDDVAHSFRHQAPFVPSVNEDATMKARRRARESTKRTPELTAAEAHGQAFLVRSAKRVPGSSTRAVLESAATRAVLLCPEEEGTARGAPHGAVSVL